MKNNFRTLISGILSKTSSLYPKKQDVYTKLEAASKEDVKALTYSNVGAAPKKHEHPYMQLKSTPAKLPSGYAWQSIAYGDGKFVATSSGSYQSTYTSNKVAYSEDGANWYESNMPNDGYWDTITYGNGKFVAIATNFTTHYVAYSEDGINWIPTNMPNFDNINSITYGNGRFVAVESHGSKSFYSDDCINWYESNMPSQYGWYSVAYGNGKFVAIAGEYGKVAYSEDGINWTESSIPYTSGLEESYCVYGNNKFVSVSRTSSQAIYSEDGINWKVTTMPNNNSGWISIAYGNNQFVALNSAYKTIAYSRNGIDWTQVDMPSSGEWHSIAYGNNQFVAIGHNHYQNQVTFSFDGINWQTELNEVYQDGELITPEQLGVSNSGSGSDVSLDGYATEEYVTNKINQAITGAIGGSY